MEMGTATASDGGIASALLVLRNVATHIGQRAISDTESGEPGFLRR